MIATWIFKFDLEIAEIIEVKVGTRHLEINILLLQSQKKWFWFYRCQLWPQLSQLFLNRFSKFLCLSCSKFSEFFKNVPTFAICMSRSQQKSKLQRGNSFTGHPVQCMYLHNVSTAGCCVDQHRGQQLLSLRDLRAAAGAGPGRGQDQPVLHPQEQ